MGDAIFLEGAAPMRLPMSALKLWPGLSGGQWSICSSWRRGIRPSSRPSLPPLGIRAIHITRHGETIFLEGVVPTELEKERAEKIAAAFTPHSVKPAAGILPGDGRGRKSCSGS